MTEPLLESHNNFKSDSSQDMKLASLLHEREAVFLSSRPAAAVEVEINVNLGSFSLISRLTRSSLYPPPSFSSFSSFSFPPSSNMA